jgi:hypothetical protein
MVHKRPRKAGLIAGRATKICASVGILEWTGYVTLSQ